MPHVIFLKVDVDELEAVSKEYEVEAMPTFVLIKEGQILDRVDGAKKDELQITIIKHAGAWVGTSCKLGSNFHLAMDYTSFLVA
ncbi:hypothetical protein ACET3Z_018911 [Daucus carota]|nr:PREDICTED: thioredoxin H-type 1-like [Daucus carota subsp. sativus]XP_017228107.1 PREDICTED: thioredoxin H-type 1-like [Daucus carota subsp. sativus]XP_017238180.1 PREDICTED: thioredoxin H-type 1-like [Daucus carota subsp. sativus]XP_017249358.1 PREDICTED: thioredoxin H-type 1-like isoform X1 [Daucus carota subsp. sativus]XP_017249360.1 PREDICTED: thioredoxin H-type 1-like isoform X2 [Daucus carota subsp. sativus]